MADYNPFQRGPAPVGTRGYSWIDNSRQHTMPVDVWYPATDAYQGQDLDPETMDKYEMVPGMGESTQMAVKDAEAASGEYPLIVFSHGFGGERRQSTFFYSHLASHGYVVAAMDHVGNTTVDMISGEATGGDPAVIDRFIQSRPLDASFVIDQMLAGEAGLAVLPDQVGMSGHSFGGWTTLKSLESDDRIKAALPLAPAGGYSSSDPESAMAKALNFAGGRAVPTLYLVGELDSVLPLDGMQDLYNRNPEPRTTVVLSNADHFHFNDNIEETHDGFQMMMGMMAAGMEGEEQEGMQTMLANMKASSDLVPGSHAYAFINGLGLAHFDATLRGRTDAAAMLSSDLVLLMAERNVAVSLLS
jgi:predicted dienelactone hydrolase